MGPELSHGWCWGFARGGGFHVSSGLLPGELEVAQRQLRA